ncbi:probable ATP-dependent RNA helicase DDX28 [Ambystoma mexicanum]|uniref:probable ATP-dependent RNA helicase DDX28 n=1 Tax=Ambystoma mexicanum TaxID=8296 RepID=UPI0037E8F1C1
MAAVLICVGPVPSSASLLGVRVLLSLRRCSTAGPVVIRIPRALQLRAERASTARSGRGQSVRPVLSALPGRLLISTRRRDLNQHTGQTYRRLGPAPRIVSGGWKHRLSTGDHFTINNTRDCTPSLPGKDEAPLIGFEDLGVSPALSQALSIQGFLHPTWVQRQAIPQLLRGGNVLCAAETGSGKTLGYLLPLFQRLLGEETSAIPGQTENATTQTMGLGQEVGQSAEMGTVLLHGQNPHTPKWIENQKSNTIPKTFVSRLWGDSGPRCLVLVPSRELADQVYNVAASIAQHFRLKVKSIGGGRGMVRVEKTLSGHADLLVATPGAMCKALQKDLVTLRNLRFIVLDEADTLCDESFNDLVEEILLQVDIFSGRTDTAGLKGEAQLVVIGATFPKGVGELLGKFTDLGHITTLKSRRLHFLMPHIKQTFLKIKGADKLTELLAIIKKQSPGAGVLVFCNSARTVNWLGYVLDDHAIKHLRLQGQMPADMRTGIFNSFQKGLTDVLVCTDIASRGLDSTRVELVINYDFPLTLQDYIHRAGRVGRVGSKYPGTVISFVTHKWDVELVQKVETAARKKTVLPGMESSMKQPIPKTDLIQFDPETEE